MVLRLLDCSLDFSKSEILTAALTNKVSHSKMADIMLEDGAIQIEVLDKIGELVYTHATEKDT